MDDRIRCVLDYLGYNCIIVNPIPGVEESIVFLYPDEIGAGVAGVGSNSWCAPVLDSLIMFLIFNC